MRIGTLKESYVADAALFDSRTQKIWLGIAAALLVLDVPSAATLPELHQKAKFMRVTTAGREESHPLDVTITHESPNYHRST